MNLTIYKYMLSLISFLFCTTVVSHSNRFVNSAFAKHRNHCELRSQDQIPDETG
jgi:hypothetical protein